MLVGGDAALCGGVARDIDKVYTAAEYSEREKEIVVTRE